MLFDTYTQKNSCAVHLLGLGALAVKEHQDKQIEQEAVYILSVGMPCACPACMADTMCCPCTSLYAVKNFKRPYVKRQALE